MCAIARVEIVDDADRDDQVEKLGGVVVVAWPRCMSGTSARAALAAAQLDARSRSAAAARGRNARRPCRMHEQRFQRVADGRPRGLAVDQQVAAPGRDRPRIDVQMADALVVLDHRHARVLGDEADQALAAARDRQVDSVVSCSSSTIASRRGPRRASTAAVGQRLLRASASRSAAAIARLRVERLRSAAQQHRIAGLQAQRRGVGGHVRPRLVDHRDQAERYAHALDAACRSAASRVRVTCPTGSGSAATSRRPRAIRGECARVEAQAVEHAPSVPLARGLRHVQRVGIEDRLRLRLQRSAIADQQRRAWPPSTARQRRAAASRQASGESRVSIPVVFTLLRLVPTRSSRCTIVSP